MRYYETLIITKPTLSDEEKQKIVDDLKEIISKYNGEVAAVDNIGVRELAYEIQKFPRGHYYIIYYKGTPEGVRELERIMRYNEDLLRFMTVKYETKKDIKRWEEMVKNV